jgi:hypothetical protein
MATQKRTYFLILLAVATASSACYREALPVEQPRPAPSPSAPLPQTIPTSPRLRWSAQPAPSTVHPNVSLSDSRQSLLLFGGSGHEVFLGCLNCSEHEPKSVQNKYGDFGNKYSDHSIFNRYSDYGSRYSSYGVCNKYASDPPAIFDGEGHYFGRLTTSRSMDQVQDPMLVGWLTAVCEHQR